MKNISLILALTLLLLLQTTYGKNIASKEIDEYLRPFVSAKQFSGVILAMRDGKVIHEKAYGFAKAEQRAANQSNTKFVVASVTKRMTAVILIRLLQQKKHSLEDKVSKFIPDFPNGKKITIDMLWSHTSGIPHRVTRPEEKASTFTLTQVIEKVKNVKLVFEPGTSGLYSSAGFSVLTRILEISAGKSYPELLREHVFLPAKMNHSLNFRRGAIKDKANEYLLDARGIINAPLKDYSFLEGAGSVISTAGDVYKFGEAFLNGTFGNEAKMAYAGRGVFSDNGMTNGFRCYVKIDNNQKYGYVIVSNLASGANDLLVKTLSIILEGKTPEPVVIPSIRILDEFGHSMNELSGTYKLGDNRVGVSTENNQLYLGEYKLYPLGKDRFYGFFGYAEVSFIRDRSGEVKEFEWKSPAYKVSWSKIK